MDGAPAPDQDLAALAASLQSDSRDSAVFFQVLCTTLASALPESTTVERARSMFKAKRLARRVTVRLETETFEAEQSGGGITCRHVHNSVGVGGGMPYSRVVTVNEWIGTILETLGRVAADRSAATEALRSLTT